jgi:hypothetical protein
MENLVLLSTVAASMPRPKRKRAPNPRCSKPGHSSWKKESIQRHTCSQCFKERAAFLFANPNLTRWDVACILVREFRNYYCFCCILSAGPKGERIAFSRYCNKGHRAICKQRRCIMHNRRLTDCRECPDPRAGTSFHVCGKRLAAKCNCGASSLGDHPQEPHVVELKEKFAENTLRRAQEMQLV